MFGALTDRDLGFCILFGMLALVLIYFGVSRYRVRRLFGRGQTDSTALGPVRRKLDEINANCRRFVFSAQRLTTVSLAGHSIVLIYGLVGFIEPMEGGTGMRVYTIAEGDEIEWMRHFPDVFELADSTASSAIFWVKLPALMRLTKRDGTALVASR